MADEKQLEILRQGPDAWNAWRPKDRSVTIDLSRANLHGADLGRADITAADLRGANLNGANLNGAKLRGAVFIGAYLNAADLRRADLSQAVLRETVFANTNLSQTLGLDSCHHYGPSTIDYRSLAQSGPLPRAFLEGVGLPNHFIDYLPSLLNEPIQFESCFISYNHHDEPFTQRLYHHLRAANLQVWYAPEDMKGGRYLVSCHN